MIFFASQMMWNEGFKCTSKRENDEINMAINALIYLGQLR